MSVKLHRFAHEAASQLFPVLAWAPEERLFLLEDATLGFGFVCMPLPGADDGAAERFNVLLNQDWLAGTRMQIALWASPDIETALAAMENLCLHQPDPLLKASAARRGAFLRAGADQPIESRSGVRVHNLQVLLTVKLPLAASQPTEREMRTPRRCAAAASRRSTARAAPAARRRGLRTAKDRAHRARGVLGDLLHHRGRRGHRAAHRGAVQAAALFHARGGRPRHRAAERAGHERDRGH